MLNDRENGKQIFTVGNLISVAIAAAMAGAAYAASSRGNDDLWKFFYEFKKDVKEWQANEGVYDKEIRDDTRRMNDRINSLQMQLGYPTRQNGPPP